YHADSDEIDPGTTYSVETIYTKHDRRYLTIGIGISSHSKSTGAGNITARFEVIDINTDEVLGSIQEYIYGGGDTSWHDLTVDSGFHDCSNLKSAMYRHRKITITESSFNHDITTRLRYGE